ncbi:ATP-binding protein [Myxococcus eversor]|uniref:ATP-binding protein n=1 Tax=Myxococcus eversor TaxID=2709661 RepID=UPI0013D84DC1|nr:ATP-binding protein [Myxococcus eversor]
MPSSPRTIPAAGRATEAGMSFQAGVGLWFAAYIVSDRSIGRRFGLSDAVRPIELQFETGIGLDDILLKLSDGNAIFVQCKTGLSLSADPASDLGTTLHQLVRLLLALRSGVSRGTWTVQDSTQCSAVLAVAADAPRTLDHLHASCRAFDFGGDWPTILAQLNAQRRVAMELFEQHVRSAWQTETNSGPTCADLVELARLFRIERFDIDSGSADWRDASRVLGSSLFEREGAGDTPLSSLLGTVRGLVQSGAPADQRGLLRALRTAGHEDTRAPRYEEDIDRIRESTRHELQRLERHQRLEIGGGVLISRECLTPLDAAVKEGSILLCGEPGAGKTGLLVALASNWSCSNAPVVVISVDRLSGIATRHALRSEFGLENDLLEVLAHWPGRNAGLLVIDALDASRGGPAEAVFSSLIEEAVVRLGERWSVVASVRTFDLKSGRRFREAMRGTPPDRAYSEAGLEQVRHFKVPRLSASELSTVARANDELAALLGNSPRGLSDLLGNLFSLSIAVNLIAGGIPAASIRRITTQSDLLERYEDERLPNRRMLAAVTNTITVMVERRRLSVRWLDIQHEAMDEVLASGVLVRTGDRLEFAHHVLFDHIAGRYFLEWDEPDRLWARIRDTPAVGFILGPSLRFAMERMWRDDENGRPRSWRFIAELAKIDNLDPVVASVALRTVSGRVEHTADVEALAVLLENQQADHATLGTMLSRLVRFFGMSFSGREPDNASIAIAWATLAQRAIRTGKREFTDGVNILLWTLLERGDFGVSGYMHVFGGAARDLLAFAWAADPLRPNLATNAIRFAARAFAADPAASVRLLEQIIQEPRFSQHVHEEAFELAEGILHIAPVDPAFAVRIYVTLFSRPVPQDGTTVMGAGVSRILPVTSTRKQDYEHARWQLTQSLPRFLAAVPGSGTRALIGAANGLAEQMSYRANQLVRVTEYAGEMEVTILHDPFSPGDWRRPGDPANELLAVFAGFLRNCTPEAFRDAVGAVLECPTSSAVWAQIFECAVERIGVADDLLWPIVTTPALVCIAAIAPGAVNYLSAVYPSKSEGDRRVFETVALTADHFKVENERNSWRRLLRRFLSVVLPDALVTESMGELRAEFEREGQLTGNQPSASFEMRFSGSDDIAEELLANMGVELGRSPDREIFAASQSLGRMLEASAKEPDNSEIQSIWSAVMAAVVAVDASVDPLPHKETLHSSWGTISNALDRIVQSEHFNPTEYGQPGLDAVLELASRLAASPYPESRGEGDERDDDIGWGNWDVRVYAASSFMALAPLVVPQRPSILGALHTFLGDPRATVRLQVARQLNVLWDVAREPMWAMVARVANEEPNLPLLGFYVAGSLNQLATVDPGRCEDMLASVQRRVELHAAEGRGTRSDGLKKAVGRLVTWLYVARGRERAQAWVFGWMANLVAGESYLLSMLSSLRSALFLSYQPSLTPDGNVLFERAKGVLESVAATAVEVIELARRELQSDDVAGNEKAAHEQCCRAGARILEHACSQLYFGSGAVRTEGQEEQPGLTNAKAMRLFLRDFGPTLKRIGQAGTPRTLHYLVELYDYLSDASPGEVFDRLADILVGPAIREGYHLERMASDVLVSLVRRNLADHRAIFEGSARRNRLVEVLDVFSRAGWPEAMNLLYELPDILR